MVTATVSPEEYRKTVTQQNLSTVDRVKNLTAHNERLNHHAWTDQQIRGIPEELVEFAFKNSAALRQEFLSLGTFLAYRRSLLRAKQ
jgi:hypothetical protein